MTNEQIDNVLAVVGKAWKAKPHFRLGQLLTVATHGLDLFAVKDELLALCLNRMLEEDDSCTLEDQITAYNWLEKQHFTNVYIFNGVYTVNTVHGSFEGCTLADAVLKAIKYELSKIT